MKHTFIFKRDKVVDEDDLSRLVRVLHNVGVSYKTSQTDRRYDFVQVFTDQIMMHHIAYKAYFSGEQLRVALPAARRRGDMAVSRATNRWDNLRRRPLVPSAVRKEVQPDDTVLLDWLEKNQALINVPNTTAEWPMAHLSCQNPNGGMDHHYDTSYRSVIRRAMRHYSTPMQMPGGTKRSKRSA